MTKVERPKLLTEAVTARLRRDIVEGEFELGQALSESKIAALYDVSRTPVREAFALLGREGLVRTEPQYGTFVFTMTREQFAQLSETRSILETAALRLAYERDQAGLVYKWKSLLEAMTTALKVEDAKTYSRSDRRFHQTLFDLAGNPYLAAAGQSFSAKLAAVINRLGARPDHMARSHREHGKLLELIAAGDLEAAVDALERHIRDKGESFWTEPEPMPKSRWEKIAELEK